ncbi:MAG TPA: hypothetical protein VNH46_00230, partial [Gemmatimonadales bacterium]|nr:hypothetical protein [Gemmatimonadales bacterium]
AGRLLAGVFGDSSVMGRATRRIRPLTLTDRLTHTSTFDLASFDPDLGYQLGLGGLGSFLQQQGDSAIGAAEIRNTTLASGADLPFGLSFTLGYTRTRTSQFQRTPGGYLTTEARQREWPKGNVRFTHALRGGPIALIGLGATFRRVLGTSQAPGPNGTVQTANSSSSLAPDARVSLRNGMDFTFNYNRLHQESSANGSVNEADQNDFVAAFNHAFQLPVAVSRVRKVVRSQLSASFSTSTTCLRRIDEPTCQGVSDTRRQEYRASFDTDLARIMTGGLQFSYSISEARALDQKFSQIVLTASLQLSLFAGDYR